MPTDRPTAEELVAAVRQHLIENLAPTLEGQPAFHLRVATNALGIVERTMAEGDAMDQRELDRLRELLGVDGDLIALNRELAERIKAGAFDDRRETLLAHLRQTAIDKLRLSNPRYMVPRD
ncbi:MAG: DUF6285 domain-containing protein [Alphaproteobacteria bacterium]|jgi:hypothetical protein|nr:DUF6285 domain-containing protein [Alphaproteobacteria bacterium]MDP6816376.1 DUF6285 domain-containing protein [Alphaproteobacteria bacterium]